MSAAATGEKSSTIRSDQRTLNTLQPPSVRQFTADAVSEKPKLKKRKKKKRMKKSKSTKSVAADGGATDVGDWSWCWNPPSEVRLTEEEKREERNARRAARNASMETTNVAPRMRASSPISTNFGRRRTDQTKQLPKTKAGRDPQTPAPLTPSGLGSIGDSGSQTLQPVSPMKSKQKPTSSSKSGGASDSSWLAKFDMQFGALQRRLAFQTFGTNKKALA